PAHGGRAGLDQVRLRAVVADRLSDLVLGQLADHSRTDDEGDDQRGHRRQQHQWLPAATAPVSAATTRSMRMKREPLTSRVTLSAPLARSLASVAAISASMSSKCSPPAPNEATACAASSP